jgi:hypothetical protein
VSNDGRQHRFFKFECGVTVELRRVPPLTLQEFDRQYERDHPVPVPPKQQVDYGNGPVSEDNRAAPDFLQAIAQYNGEKARAAMDLILWKGVKVDVDAVALQEARDDAAQFGMTLPGDDRLVYIKHVLIGSSEELLELRDAILLRGQPTEAAIAQAAGEFKSPVPGP